MPMSRAMQNPVVSQRHGLEGLPNLLERIVSTKEPVKDNDKAVIKLYIEELQSQTEHMRKNDRKPQ